VRYLPHEMHARRMHACEIHVCEMHAHEMYLHEMHARKMHAREIHTHETHAYGPPHTATVTATAELASWSRFIDVSTCRRR
jgi:hypothetical protein